MRKKRRHRSKRRWATFRRLFTYTFLSFVVIEYSGIFSLASNPFLEVTTDTKINPFYPKTYTDIEIQEPNGKNYSLEDNATEVKNAEGNGKEVKFTNPSGNTKWEYVRVKVIAVVKNSDGSNASIPVVYTLSAENIDAAVTESTKWLCTTSENDSNAYFYYINPLEPGKSTTNLFHNLTISSPSVEELAIKEQHIEFSVITDTIQAQKDEVRVDGQPIFTAEYAEEAWGVSGILQVP